MLRFLAVFVAAAPTGAEFFVNEWREYLPDKRHGSHQTSDPAAVKAGFHSTLSPFQRVPLADRVPNELPPYVPTASTPQCIEVVQSSRSMSARAQVEICDDWAIGKYWLTEERDNGRAVWRMPKHTNAIRYQGDSFGWWIHRDRDRHGYPCMGENRRDLQVGGRSVRANPRRPFSLSPALPRRTRLVATASAIGTGRTASVLPPRQPTCAWPPCPRPNRSARGAVRRCGDRGDGLEPKLKSLTTQQLRLWANKLGVGTAKNERRESVVARLREALYVTDGHSDLNEYDAFLKTAVDWANARQAEALAAEEGED